MIRHPGPAAVPRRVFLFSGHMIDAPGRATPRFPPALEPAAARAIGGLLDRLGAGLADLAICGGACGGDLLLAEAALARGARLEIYLPLPEPEFLAASVDFAGDGWHERYLAARAHAGLHPPAPLPAPASAPAGATAPLPAPSPFPASASAPAPAAAAAGAPCAPPQAGASLHAAAAGPFERNNLRMLDAACRFGAGRVELVCLWDGRAGDGPGGTAHLVDEVRRRSGRTHRIDTGRLGG